MVWGNNLKGKNLKENGRKLHKKREKGLENCTILEHAQYYTPEFNIIWEICKFK